MSSLESTGKPRRIFVFDNPRTGSQLFNKLFAVHPQLEHVFHPLLGASMYGPERVALHLNHSAAAEEAQQQLAKQINIPDETYTLAATRLVEPTEAIEKKDKIPFIKDRIFCTLQPRLIKASITHGLDRSILPEELPGNPTMLTWDFFSGITPIILIRHPALVVPSYYRAEKAVFCLDADDEDFAAMTSLRWARILFDAHNESWKAANSDGAVNSSKCPIIVDALDVIHNTEELLPKLCELIRIDPAGIQYHWDPVPRDQWPQDPIMRGFFKDMLSSSEVQRGSTRKPEEEYMNLDTKTTEWVEEFGTETARSLRRRVDEEMTNYQYLRQFKLSV
ncbi:hypothetical protein BJ170DRAFT_104400 [Xylariales sp. AK1849]|nr:hypothetical protein BJ170DRAFT_104400 [Xylariales sp. AK1849]